MISIKDEGTDRRKVFEKWERRVLLSKGIKTTFFFAKRHPYGGRYGNFQSMLDVMKLAYSNDNVPYLLILEDDAKPTKYADMRKVKSAIQRLNSEYPSWEILYLGYYNVFNQVPVFPGVTEGLCVATHSFVVSRKGMKHLLETLPKYLDEKKKDVVSPTDLAIIEVLKKSEHVSFCTVPMMFTQSGNVMGSKQDDPTIVNHYSAKVQESEEMYKLTKL